MYFIDSPRLFASPHQLILVYLYDTRFFMNQLIRKNITKDKVKREVNNIIKSLKEVKDFESGEKKPKSFDGFLKTLGSKPFPSPHQPA